MLVDAGGAQRGLVVNPRSFYRTTARSLRESTRLALGLHHLADAAEIEAASN
jgi:hypothetical protein